MYNDYHDQARKMAEELISIIRRYGLEYDLDVTTVLGILELVKYDVYQSAIDSLNDEDSDS